ncbi:CCR4-associated factor 1 1 [Hirschfeldia incana]|nr:CCR4-associated factor 1 1 [Hirschfeldia incana]
MNENHHQRSRPVLRTRNVWAENINEEMDSLKEYLKLYPKVAFDTEYPGITYRTYLHSSDDDCYDTMKANVESSKLIQCGFTLFNEKGEIGGVWEFNFSNFGDPSDRRNQNSIDFLKKHGVDLDKIRNKGLDMFEYNFFPKLLNVFHSQKHVEFVTFQGTYDFAYVLSILNHGKLPGTRGEFASEVVRVFGDVYDLKVMAGFCDGLGEHLGLSKLAHLLNIPRVGRAHHAGSDSLMTALVFIKLRQVFDDSKFAKGMLYGLGKRTMVAATTTTTMPSLVASMPMMCQQNLVSYPSTQDMLFHNGYIPSYDHNQVLFWSHLAVPWMSYDNGMYGNQLNHLPSSTFAYPYQTPYASDYLGQLPDLLQ